MELTHRKVCEIGANLLKRPFSGNGHGCHFALIEPSSYKENPDVIGYRHGVVDGDHPSYDVGVIVLEVKVGRGDFLKDKKKQCRTKEKSLGRWRYYICPEGLIKPNELPDRWGLIWVNKRGHCQIIAGALAAEQKVSVCSYSGRKTKFKSMKESQELFKQFQFLDHERDLQNEQNILVMALARLGDAEQMLYDKRRLYRLESTVQELEAENRNFRAEVNRLLHQQKKQDAKAIPRQLKKTEE